LRALLVAGGLYGLNAGLGAVVAIRRNLPAAFLGRRSTRPLVREFLIGSGTALSPPAAMLVGLVAAMAVAAGGRRAGRLGVGGLGVAFTVGMLGEPIAYETLRDPVCRPDVAAIVIGNIVLPAGMAVLALKHTS
jgi:hypothetical protein